MAKEAKKTTAAPQTNVVHVQFVKGAADEAAFMKELHGQGTPLENMIGFLAKQSDVDRKVRSTVVNMIALAEYRAVVMKWPTHSEAPDMRKLITEEVFNNSERGKVLNAQIEQLVEATKTEKGEIELRLSAARSKRSFIIGKMVEARNVAAKVIEAESNGFNVIMTHGSPDVLVAHESNPLKIRKMTAGGLANVKSFVGVTDTAKLAVRGAGNDGKKIQWRNGTAALPTIQALSGHIAKWAEDPKKYGITAAVSAEMSTLFTAMAELLNVPLNASQSSVLEELSEAAPAAPEQAKTGTDN